MLVIDSNIEYSLKDRIYEILGENKAPNPKSILENMIGQATSSELTSIESIGLIHMGWYGESARKTVVEQNSVCV